MRYEGLTERESRALVLAIDEASEAGQGSFEEMVIRRLLARIVELEKELEFSKSLEV